MRGFLSRSAWVVAFVVTMLVAGIAPGRLSGQAVVPVAATPRDTIAAWVTQLRGGTLEDRMAAAAGLAARPAATLPSDARAALIGELERVNGFLIDTVPVPGATDLGEDDLGEHYVTLVGAVLSFETPEARQALARSVGVGGQVQRHVARQGDRVVPVLAEMITRGHQPDDALATMGLAWFWADSTGASLSAASRATIVRALLGATASEDYAMRRAAPEALALTADPALLPVAEAFAARAGEPRMVLGAYRRTAVPALRAAALTRGASATLAGIVRATEALCAPIARGAIQGTCAAIQQELRAARQHVDAGRLEPARRVLESAAVQADRAGATGVLTAAEQALLGGGARAVIARL